MYENNKVAVIIPAAGNSTRMYPDKNKQYIKIGGIPVLARTLSVFEKNRYVDEIILIINKKYMKYCGKFIIEKYNFSKIKEVAEGGQQRQDSCKNGIDALSRDVDFVLIHDGARPLVTDGIIENTLKSIKEHGVCCACVPVKDTVKIVNSEMDIIGTPERKSLYAAQTPQGFRHDILKEVYERAYLEKYTATDDVQIAEHYGYVPHVTEGSYENIKITTGEDLYTVKNIIKERGRHENSPDASGNLK